ncbi:MAG TPA: class II aldolase/adducin family protein [Candidatus Angelobacter sp.]|jgi:ribulose-5-phosphate 4-epimerase/fuculose-1-phosphate aldolase|nr:class II aldolase/adducin family protein [Candidatus Angelobacter sp.]
MNVNGLKFDLCCAARLLYRFGLSVGNAGHLSITIGENHMLVNRYGPSFATMNPADVLTMDFAGNVLEHDPAVKPYVNETIHLHGVIHRYNPHIAAVAHTHPPNVVTWTTFRKLPQTYDQESCLLADDIAIVDEEFTGLAQSEDRVRPFAEALGKKPVVLLPNHGAITSGPSIQSALFRMILLEGACQRNINVAAAAQSTGLSAHAIKPQHALATKNELARIPIVETLWEDLLKRLRQTDAELFEQRSPGHHARSEALSA